MTPGTPETTWAPVSGKPGIPLRVHMAGKVRSWVHVTPTVTPAATGYALVALRIDVPVGTTAGERVVEQLVLPVPTTLSWPGRPAAKRAAEEAARTRHQHVISFGVTLVFPVKSGFYLTVR